MKPVVCGTTRGYRKGCRCAECRAANAAQHRELRKKREASKTPDHVHGTEGGYGNWGCRCAPCTRAWRIKMQVDYQKRLATPTPDHLHGTNSGYSAWGCRCTDCIQGAKERRRTESR